MYDPGLTGFCSKCSVVKNPVNSASHIRRYPSKERVFASHAYIQHASDALRLAAIYKLGGIILLGLIITRGQHSM